MEGSGRRRAERASFNRRRSRYFVGLTPRNSAQHIRSVRSATLGEPVADQQRLVARRVVHDDMDIEVSGHVAFDLVEEFPELLRAMERHEGACGRPPPVIRCSTITPFGTFDAGSGRRPPHQNATWRVGQHLPRRIFGSDGHVSGGPDRRHCTLFRIA